MKIFPTSVLFILITHSLTGQTIEAYARYGRELVEGAKNNLKIESWHRGLTLNVRVSNGEIRSGTTTQTVFRDKKMLQVSDTLYFWSICESSEGFEYLYVDYSDKDSVVHSDTLKFYTKKGPVLSARAFKKSVTGGPFDADRYKEVYPSNIIGVELTGTDVSYGFNARIIQYSIEIFKNNKIVKTLINEGNLLSDENRKELTRMKNGEIRINRIEAELECGLKVDVKDVDPIKTD